MTNTTQKTCTRTDCPERTGGECTAGLITLETLQAEMREKFDRDVADVLSIEENEPFQNAYTKLHLIPYIKKFLDIIVAQSHTLGKKAGREEMAEAVQKMKNELVYPPIPKHAMTSPDFMYVRGKAAAYSEVLTLLPAKEMKHQTPISMKESQSTKLLAK